MTMKKGTIPVLAAPMFDPSQKRVNIEVPVGMSIADIIAIALPVLTASDLSHVRVALVTASASVIVSAANWSRVKPKSGVHVVIRLVPSGNLLRGALQIIVSVAAVALGQFWLGPLLTSTFGISSGLAAGIAGLGLNVLGSLLINALVPPVSTKARDQKNTYQITGWNNKFDPDGVIPEIMGSIRYAPPFGATTYTEIVGDLQYIRTIFNFGIGPLSFSAEQIGDTAATDYDEIQMEKREGLSTDQPLTLYPSQVVEQSVGAELTRPRVRDDEGNTTDDPSIETPVIRTTGADAAGASIILGFPAGVGKLTDKGDERNFTVTIKISQSPAGANTWTDVQTLDITAKKFEAFYRQFTWSFATRGRYDIKLTRMTDETTSNQTQSRSSWVALQTLRPEYPLDFPWPMALIAMRVKATYQLNGALDNFNVLVGRRALDWDKPTQTWTQRATSNPASLYRWALQSPTNPKAVSNSAINLEELQDWHEFCDAKGLKYDKALEDATKLDDVLTEIAVAGRATPRHDGIQYGVVIDRPQDLVVDHINPRNSWAFKSTRAYVKTPDAVRVSFLDATNDFKPAERLIPWPGHSGDIVVIEKWEMPGKTDPAEIWIETRRRMYEAMYRPDVYTAMQDGPARVATRGDLIMGSFDTLQRTQVAAAVVSVEGKLIELDDIVTMIAGQSYAVRFRIFADEDDTIGMSVVRSVQTMVGDQMVVLVTGDGDMPDVGSLLHFGLLQTESMPLFVTRVEAGQDFSSAYTFVDAAPLIDELTDEEVAPPWSGRAGADIGDNDGKPPTPVFVSIATGIDGTDVEGGLQVNLKPGIGSIQSSIFRLEHRLLGATSWTIVDFPAVNGGITIAGYSTADQVQLRAAAISAVGTVGDFGIVVSVTIGSSDAALPKDLDDATIDVGALLGGAMIIFSTTDDAATTAVQIYRSTTGSGFNRSTDAIGAATAVLPSRGYTIGDGDTTRTNLISDSGFDNPSAWTADADWTVASGLATHVAGAADTIYKALSLAAGKYYRVAYTASGISAGTVKSRLSGGSNVDGAARSTNGNVSNRLLAASGNNAFGFVADTPFAGSIDNAIVFVETATCLAAGTYYYFLEPQNSDGVPGPVSGPFAVVIR